MLSVNLRFNRLHFYWDESYQLVDQGSILLCEQIKLKKQKKATDIFVNKNVQQCGKHYKRLYR